MKHLLLLSLFILTCSASLLGQTVQMELADPQPFLQGGDTGDMEFADLDGDGDADLIITGSGNMSDGTTHGALTTLYFNDGEGNLTPITDHGIVNLRVSKIALADVDDDNDLDLMVSGSNTSTIPVTKLYLNDGSGNFTEDTGAPFASIEKGYFNFGDVDGDNDLDIIFSGGHAGIDDVVKYVNDGDGNFTLDTTIGVTDISGVLDLSDIDNDNDLDLIIIGQDPSENIITRLYFNDGSGNFTMATDPGFNNIHFGDIATGDTDGDGDLDVLINGSNTTSNFVTEFYTNNGNGTFTQVTDGPFLGLAADGEVSFNDFDNDGDLDAFVIGAADGGLPNIFSHIYENQGANNFILSDEFVGGYLSTHAVADVDGDGLLDLVFGGTTTGSPVRGSFLYKNVSKVLSTNDETLGSGILIYPNPSAGNLNIDLGELSRAQFEIYNLIGQRIYTKTLNTGLNNLQVSLSNGVYLVVITNENKSYSRKLVVRN